MRHLRQDYEAIQPWPTKRPHIVKCDGEVIRQVGVAFRSLEDDRLITMAEDAQPDIEPLIPDDEPVFLLRAKDAAAPRIVRDWAELTHAASGNNHLGPNCPCEPCKLYERVMAWADEMEAYAAEHYDGGKVADTPPGMLR